ncbi:MAG: helix-turn-helix transcriptional regulator [Clostridiales bacterium]|nr:helix-turn-helix transcriptional regulator [Clostridiales bacterium]
MKGIGIIIKELRKEMGCSQNQLADVLGVTQDSISLWENDKRIPDAPYIITMAKFFDVTTDYLLGLSGDYKRVAVGTDYEQEFVKEEIQLIYEYRKLSDDKKKLVDELISVLKK